MSKKKIVLCNLQSSDSVFTETQNNYYRRVRESKREREKQKKCYVVYNINVTAFLSYSKSDILFPR